jgi:hypothetical protein
MGNDWMTARSQSGDLDRRMQALNTTFAVTLALAVARCNF